MSEVDPNGKNPHEPGAKLDAGKPPVLRGVIQYFPLALKAVALVSLFGANKYAWKGWESVPDGVNRYGDALVRHLTDEQSGVIPGADMKLLEMLYSICAPTPEIMHSAQAAWNALAKLELMIRESPN